MKVCFIVELLNTIAWPWLVIVNFEWKCLENLGTERIEIFD